MRMKEIAPFSENIVIHKYELQITDYQTIAVPTPWQPLSIQFQKGKLCVWGIVDPEKPKELCPFWIVGTGQSIPESALFYIDTVQEGAFVWHIFTGEALPKNKQVN